MRFLLEIIRSFREIRRQNCCWCISTSSLRIRTCGQQLITPRSGACAQVCYANLSILGHFCVHYKPGEEEDTPSGVSYQHFSGFQSQ